MTTNYQPKPYLTQEQFADKVVRAQSNEIGMLQERVKSLLADLERAEAERDHARACNDHAIKQLVRVHSLLYPAPVNAGDDRTMVFRPKNLDPHEILQELSDRIRAIPAEIQLASAAPVAQQGWRLVPIYPTQLMRDAGNKTLDMLKIEPGMGIADRAFYAYKSMLAAAPEVP